MRSFTSSRPVWSASRTARASATSSRSSERVAPRQLEHRVEPRADPAVLGALLARALEPVDLALDRGAHRRRAASSSASLRAVLGDASSSSPSPSSLRIACHLLAQQELALLLVHALGDVVADLLGDLELGERCRGPRQHQLDPARRRRRSRAPRPCARVGMVGPRVDGVGQRAGLGRRCAGSRASAATGAARRSPRSTARSSRPSSSALGGRRRGSSTASASTQRPSVPATPAPSGPAAGRAGSRRRAPSGSSPMFSTRATVPTWA